VIIMIYGEIFMTRFQGSAKPTENLWKERRINLFQQDNTNAWTNMYLRKM